MPGQEGERKKGEGGCRRACTQEPACHHVAVPRRPNPPAHQASVTNHSSKPPFLITCCKRPRAEIFTTQKQKQILKYIYICV